MAIVYIEEDESIFTGQYEKREGFGKCYICCQLSAITFVTNNKGQVTKESKECYSCKDEFE
ncbi:hypothetical protein ACFVQB_14815 [Paenibacillus sp. NPDC057886]|uniref:hypothetical protein n=1 Tax=Paenibacillus sp. NPDC057886 TaxID=3346270 RepID=UPI0036CBF622